MPCESAAQQRRAERRRRAEAFAHGARERGEQPGISEARPGPAKRRGVEVAEKVVARRREPRSQADQAGRRMPHRLHAAGFLSVVVTNQPDVARGAQSREVIEAMHTHLRRSGLPIDAFYICYHDGPDNCDCRKPWPGMLLTASSDLLIDLEHSCIVGDRWRDIEAGLRAGCTPFLVDYGYAETRPRPPYIAVDSLASAVQWILDGSMPFAFMPAESYVPSLTQQQRA